jgi:hypothetical protein
MDKEEKKTNAKQSASAGKPPLPGAGKPAEIPIAARYKGTRLGNLLLPLISIQMPLVILGPGPAAYTLPSTIGTSTREGRKAPAYSFGMRLQNKSSKIYCGVNMYRT